MKIGFSIIVAFTLTCMAVAAEKPVASVVLLNQKQAAPIAFTGNSTIDMFSVKESDNTAARPMLNSFDTPSGDESGDAKSPWIAGGLSLVLPGAGEFYSHSYIKAGVFFGVEVASFFLSRSYNKKGDDQTAFFESYADQHYKVGQYAKWTLDNISILNPNIPASDITNFQAKLLNNAPDSPPFANVNWDVLNAMETEIMQQSDNGYTHNLPNYGAQQYYELIGKYTEFMSGWDMTNPAYLNGGIQVDLPVSDHTLPIAGSGLSQAAWYFDQRAQANHYYDIGTTYVSVLVINHIVSALDAYWSATRYNNSLHAEADMKMLPTPNGMVAVPEAKVRYDF